MKQKIIYNPNDIVGPLGKLIALGESRSLGYNAISNVYVDINNSSLLLTNMTIKEIMERQSLQKNNPDKFYAVGKYQCIPSTLKEACEKLGIDINEKFNQKIQDMICQDYLLSRKRPNLVSYYNNKNKNDEILLKNAGISIAAEFGSVEDPNYPGYPYGGPNGNYVKYGNKVQTTWKKIKIALKKEWEFRNIKKEPL